MLSNLLAFIGCASVYVCIEMRHMDNVRVSCKIENVSAFLQ